MEIFLFVKLSSNKITLNRKKLKRKMWLKINRKNGRGVWAIIHKVKASIPNFFFRIFKLFIFFNLRKNEWRKHENIFSHSLDIFTLIFIFYFYAFHFEQLSSVIVRIKQGRNLRFLHEINLKKNCPNFLCFFKNSHFVKLILPVYQKYSILNLAKNGPFQMKGPRITAD